MELTERILNSLITGDIFSFSNIRKQSIFKSTFVNYKKQKSLHGLLSNSEVSDSTVLRQKKNWKNVQTASRAKQGFVHDAGSTARGHG